MKQGAILIAVAALLWSTDALVRFPATGESSSLWVVWVEHILVVLALAPVLLGQKENLKKLLNQKDLILLILIGAGGSALALWMFTESFQRTNPSIAILLQKVQPIVVVFTAMLFLGERPHRRFYILAPLVVVSAAFLSWPDGELAGPQNWKSWEGAFLSLGSAVIWAISTVAGRSLLLRYPTRLITFMRYFFGAMALGIFVALEGGQNAVNLQHLTQWHYLWPLLYLTFVTGLAAMYVYYKGMAETPASLVTMIELLYPLGAVVLNAAFLGFEMTPVQWGAGLFLIVTTTWISLDQEAKVESTG